MQLEWRFDAVSFCGHFIDSLWTKSHNRRCTWCAVTRRVLSHAAHNNSNTQTCTIYRTLCRGVIQCGSHTANDNTEEQNVHSYIYIYTQICCGVIRCSWNNAWLNTCTHSVHWCRGHSVEVYCPTGEVGRVVQPWPAKPRGACDPNSPLVPVDQQSLKLVERVHQRPG